MFLASQRRALAAPVAGALALVALVCALAPIAHAQLASGVNKTNMDTSCQPCKDFYRYANGKWLDSAVIPESYTVIGAAREIADRNQEILHEALEKAAANADTEKDPTIKKVGILYRALMDSTRADQDGLKPMQPEFDRVKKIATKQDLQSEFAHTVVAALGGGFGGAGTPFHIGAEIDPGQSSMYVAQIFQGGLGLPERDFYFRTDPKSEALRKAYVAHLGRMLTLIGETANVDDRASKVMALETAMAESSMARVAMRDPHALYHKIPVKELAALCPAIDWNSYFNEVGVPALASPTAMIDVSQPVFMRHLSQLIETTPLDTWKDLLLIQVARSRAPWSGQAAFDELFSMQALFTGSKTPPARWKRASSALDNAMGEAVGKAYVAVAFPPSSKARMLDLVNNLQAAMQERIESRPWMSEETKKQAVAKLSAVLKKIGYPDTWRDYTALQIDAGVPAPMLLQRAGQFEVHRRLARIGQPVDRTEWGMTPPTVNAYYNPLVNEIVFPAGILQPPYFDPKVDDAYNYGSIGMVIGHEITHGFDDEGSQYDKSGNLANWWTREDRAKFDAKTQQVVDQYNAYVAVDTLHVNGKLTLGENIADIGGLTIAYAAWKRSLHGKPAPVIDGLTGEQRFFLGHAQGWRRKLRPEMVRTTTLTDEHSPAEWRVNGPLSVMPEFAEAFHCKEGDPMDRPDKDRPAIW